MLSAFSNISSQSDSIFTHFDEIIAFDKNAAFHHESVRILGNAFVGPEYQNSCSKGFVFEVASLLSKWSYPLYSLPRLFVGTLLQQSHITHLIKLEMKMVYNHPPD